MIYENSQAARRRRTTTDRTAPSISIVSRPAAYINQNSTSVSFSVSDAGGVSRVECSFDGSAYSSCTSPKSLPSLSDKAYSLMIRAVDNSGNIATSQVNFTVDTTKPVVLFSTVPPSTSQNTTAGFSFSVADANQVSVQCSLDSAAFASCVSPTQLLNLQVGSHNFSVRAVDAAGNPQIVSYSFAVEAPSAPQLPSVTNLAWDANTETNIRGYKLYYGKQPGAYSNFIDMGMTATPSAPQYSVDNSRFEQGSAYYFTVTAYDSNNIESDFSNEVSKEMP